MQTIDQLSSVVQHNCHISDSLYAGDYGMCIYLLKMREFYRWEKHLPFSEKLISTKVGDWLQQREALWDGLQELAFECLPLDSDCVDPFNAETINESLVPKGLVYSAGFGLHKRPHFFLGKLLRAEKFQDYQVLIADDELARDLAAPPAMMQGNTIYVRRESFRRLLWEKVDTWLWNRPDNAMKRALAFYDFDDDLNAALDAMTENEIESVILHEIGERVAGEQLGSDWGKLISSVAGTRAEIMARAVRDHIADCSITWPALIEENRLSSLHFYFANFTAMRQTLFPSAMKIYEQWANDGDLKSMRAMVAEGRRHWLGVAQHLLAMESDNAETLVTGVQAFIEQEGIY